MFGLKFLNETHLLELFAGEAHSLKVDKILFRGKSDFQDVMVFQVSDDDLYVFIYSPSTKIAATILCDA